MEWTQGDIQKLIEFTDYSAETDLKHRLFKEITSHRRISFDELSESIGREKGNEIKEKRGRERHVPQSSVSRDSVMDNDDPILPGGR